MPEDRQGARRRGDEAMDDVTDVLVIGAGPVGMTLANELARRGVGFRIVDRRAGDPRGLQGDDPARAHPGGARQGRRRGARARGGPAADPGRRLRLWRADRRLGSRRHRQPLSPSADPRPEPDPASAARPPERRGRARGMERRGDRAGARRARARKRRWRRAIRRPGEAGDDGCARASWSAAKAPPASCARR